MTATLTYLVRHRWVTTSDKVFEVEAIGPKQAVALVGDGRGTLVGEEPVTSEGLFLREQDVTVKGVSS